MPGLLQSPEGNFRSAKVIYALVAEFLGTMLFTFAGTATPVGNGKSICLSLTSGKPSSIRADCDSVPQFPHKRGQTQQLVNKRVAVQIGLLGMALEQLEYVAVHSVKVLITETVCLQGKWHVTGGHE